MTKLPPGPPGRLLSTYRTLSDCFRWFPEWHERYGDPFMVRAVNGDIVLTSDPARIRQIFTADPALFDPFGAKAVAPIVGSGSLFVLTGDAHRRERKLLMPPFHGARMRTYGHQMQDVTVRHLSSASPGESFQGVAQRLSLDVILRTVFGVEEAERVNRFSGAITELVDGVHPAFLFMPFLQLELGGFGPYGRFMRRYRALDVLLKDEIRSARARGTGEDILSLLVNARYEDGAPMDDEAICSELRTLVTAGHETTALVLSWAVDFLHRDRSVLDRAVAEIDGLGPAPSPEQLANLEYLEAVCKEALRLYPIVTEVMRTLTAPFELGPHRLPAGTVVGANIVLAHRNPERFPDPERFRPERFLGATFSPFEYLPFGGGHRRCIGAAFATFEMKVVLGTLLSRYRVELLNDVPPRPVRRNVTIAPSDGVPVRLHPREAALRTHAA